MDYPEKIICQVRTVKEEVVAVAVEAGPAEPEVIGKKKEEEVAEGAEGDARPRRRRQVPSPRRPQKPQPPAKK